MAESTDIQCSSHSCEKHIDAAHGEYRLCSLCLKAAYCSEECRQIDWVMHQCSNVIESSDADLVQAVPYYYEDMLTQEELEELPVDSPVFQSHTSLFSNVNGQKREYDIPAIVANEHKKEVVALSKDNEAPLATGAAPSAKWKNGADYDLDIRFGGARHKEAGRIPDDMIFPSNNNNRTAKEISGATASSFFKGGFVRFFRKATGVYIFWRTLSDAVVVPRSGSGSIALVVNGKDVKKLKFGYDLPPPGKSDVADIARWVKKTFSRNLALKFRDGPYSDMVKYMVVRRFEGTDGTGVLMTFLNQAEPRLIDVEFVANKVLVDSGSYPEYHRAEKEASWIKSDMNFNSRNFSHVVALGMRLADVLATTSLTAKEAEPLQDCAAILRRYEGEMERNGGHPPKSIDSDVEYAISKALQISYVPIEKTINQWRSKAKEMDTFKLDYTDALRKQRQARKEIRQAKNAASRTRWKLASLIARKDLERARAIIHEKGEEEIRNGVLNPVWQHFPSDAFLLDQPDQDE
jgi:hypothetical protein